MLIEYVNPLYPFLVSHKLNSVCGLTEATTKTQMSEAFIRTHVFSISLQAYHSTADYEMWRVHHHFIVLLSRQRPALESISASAKYVKEIDRTQHILPAHRSADNSIRTVEAPVDIEVKTTDRVVDHPPSSSSSPPRFVFACISEKCTKTAAVHRMAAKRVYCLAPVDDRSGRTNGSRGMRNSVRAWASWLSSHSSLCSH